MTSAPFSVPSNSAGTLIRQWRQHRRLSQLACALEAEISQKHLSFIESGRSRPSREMVLRLAERLGIPLRDRNALMLAAGYAPLYPERSLDDPVLAPARSAVELILKGHDPYPALAIDRHWTLLGANAAVQRLLALVLDATLLSPPINVLRLSLSPGGLAPHIVNLPAWRAHLLERLRQQISWSPDHQLTALRAELEALPSEDSKRKQDEVEMLGGIAVPICIRTQVGLLSMISTTTIFGTPVDVTLSELALETFFPANEATAAALRELAGER